MFPYVAAHRHAQYSLRWMLAGVLMAMLSIPSIAAAQSSRMNLGSVSMYLAPHCLEQDRSRCPTFDVQDPATLVTQPLNAGDILDIDVVVSGLTTASPTTFRAWLQYDPSVLEARNIELSPLLSQPLPGEQTFDATSGVVKIGGATSGPVRIQDASIARVTFRVLSSTKLSAIRFMNFSPGDSGETSITNSDGQNTLSSLTVEPSALALSFPSSVTSSSSSLTFSSSPYGSNPLLTTSSQSSTSNNSPFSLLQIQNVHATSKDATIFVGWSPLSTTQLAGYNVYYGTVSGRYIQRHSVPFGTNSVVLRDLESGRQYFLAVRGYNTQNEETSFSQEVAVVVGRPETSTAPFAQDSSMNTQIPVNGNPLQTRGSTRISGDTGLSDGIMILLMVSACIGTAFAARKHLFPRSIS